MEELEMSPGYDIDNEPPNFSENGQREKSEQEIMTADLQGRDSDRTSREKTHGLSESEIITSGVAIQGSGSLREKAITSERDACCSERGGQAISSSRKRPHPDS
jgi:high-affinity K+ transport system ATPase subunit B